MDEVVFKQKMKILEAREERVALIEQLIKNNYVIIVLRANYPGDSKDNEVTRKLIEIMDAYINTQFYIKETNKLNCGEGLVYIYMLDTNQAKEIKKQTIEIENKHPLGRLVDIDVYYRSIESLSRQALNVKRRSCLLCNQDAFICIKNQNHTLEELHQTFKRMVKQYGT